MKKIATPNTQNNPSKPNDGKRIDKVDGPKAPGRIPQNPNIEHLPKSTRPTGQNTKKTK